MSYQKYAKIRVRPIVYERDESGNIVLDTNDEKIIAVQPENVDPKYPYDILIEIDDIGDTISPSLIPDIYDTTTLYSPTSSLDYRLWASYWMGYDMWDNNNQYDFTNSNYPYKGIVPMLLVPYQSTNAIGYNGQRYPLTNNSTPNTVYSPNSEMWDTFTTRMRLIPQTRRTVLGLHWFADLNYYTKGVVDYYKNPSRDGTTWQGTNFLTPWVETNASDAKASYQSFLDKCKDDDIIFDYIADDREAQHFFYINGNHNDNNNGGTPAEFGTESSGHTVPDGGRLVQDARYISAVINDSRFTTKVNPKTGMTFAQEFIYHFKLLWQKHWYFKNIPLPDPMPSYTEILSPWANITSNTAFARWTNYWLFYGCTSQDRDVPNRVPCVGSSGNCGPFGTFKSLQPANYNDTNKLTGYGLFHLAIPAWNATIENWLYGNYIYQQIQETNLSAQNLGFNNTKHFQYQHSAINAEESAFYQQSNLDPEYLPVIEKELYGPSFYGYHGNVEYVVSYVPTTENNPPNGYTNTQWADNHSYRSGYVKSPLNDHEKYSWSGYGDLPYGGASCATNNLVRYPETSMVNGSNNWISGNMNKFMSELSYKVLVREIKYLRHIVRSNDNYENQLVPWITGPNWSNQSVYGYNNYGYWLESMFHLFLHNPLKIAYWNGFYGPKNGQAYGQEDAVQFALDHFRTITKNLEIQPCSNSIGSTTEKSDRLILEDVFEKYLISGCKIKDSNVHIWRLSIPPKYFNPTTGIATLSRVGNSSDLPETIQINSNYDIKPGLQGGTWEEENVHESRGVWVIRRKPEPPIYLPNPV